MPIHRHRACTRWAHASLSRGAVPCSRWRSFGACCLSSLSHTLWLAGQYIEHLFTTLPKVSEQEEFEGPYLDYLQMPLQPLADNLESQTYETFERDPIKYRQYEAAVKAALMDTPVEKETVLMVVCARSCLAQPLSASWSCFVLAVSGGCWKRAVGTCLLARCHLCQAKAARVCRREEPQCRYHVRSLRLHIRAPCFNPLPRN